MHTAKFFTHVIVKNGTNRLSRKTVYSQYLFAAATLFICVLLLSITALGAYTILPAKVNYHITKIFTIKQHAGEAQIYLGLLLPRSGPYQVVEDVAVRWDGRQETSSRAYVDLLKLSAEIPRDSEKLASIEYDLVLRQGGASWQAPVDRNDLLAQAGIESDHEDIQQAAAWITSANRNDPAYEIFQLTSN